MNATPTLDEIVQTLRTHEAALRQRGVARVAVFGSVARGDATPFSDVDLLLDLDPANVPTLLDYVGIQMDLVALLGREVHLAVRENLKRYIRPEAERDAVYAF